MLLSRETIEEEKVEKEREKTFVHHQDDVFVSCHNIEFFFLL